MNKICLASLCWLLFVAVNTATAGPTDLILYDDGFGYALADNADRDFEFDLDIVDSRLESKWGSLKIQLFEWASFLAQGGQRGAAATARVGRFIMAHDAIAGAWREITVDRPIYLLIVAKRGGNIVAAGIFSVENAGYHFIQLSEAPSGLLPGGGGGGESYLGQNN